MLDSVFGFSGRINRIQYCLGNLGLGAALVLPMAALFVLAPQRHGAGAAGVLAFSGLIAMAAIPVFLWVSFSLQARRFRDIGVNPLVVIAALVAVSGFDQLVARAVPVLSVSKFSHQTPIGLMVSLAAIGALLFWPGRAGDDEDAPAFAADWPLPLQIEDDLPGESPDQVTHVTPAAPIRAAATIRSAQAHVAPLRSGMQPAPSFGRRGL